MSDIGEITITDLIDEQIQQQGVSVIGVKDGHVLTFTVEILERLLTLAGEVGQVVVFVRHGAES